MLQQEKSVLNVKGKFLSKTLFTPFDIWLSRIRKIVLFSRIGQVPGKPIGGRHGMIFGQIHSSSTIGNTPPKPLVPGQRHMPSLEFSFSFLFWTFLWLKPLEKKKDQILWEFFHNIDELFVVKMFYLLICSCWNVSHRCVWFPYFLYQKITGSNSHLHVILIMRLP